MACYITPDSFLLGRYFSKIRRTILNYSATRTILMFKEDFWKSGVVGRPTVISYQKAGGKEPNLDFEFMPRTSSGLSRYLHIRLLTVNGRRLAHSTKKLFKSAGQEP